MMIEEQLLEVNKKIKQIKTLLNKRKEKASECTIDYRKLLEQKPNKSLYLDKKFQQKVDFKDKPKDTQQYKLVKQELERKASESRLRIQQHYNELKDLDLLQKQKTKIRSVLLHRNLQQKENQVHEINYRPSESDKMQGSELKLNNLVLRRTIKDRSNPFLDIKAQNFIDLFMQAKNNSENLGPKLMKFFGVGLESTPLGSTLKAEEKEDLFTGNEMLSSEKKRMSRTHFGKTFSQTFSKKKDILGMAYKPRNIFEDRMRKIIKCHGNFWGEHFEA